MKKMEEMGFIELYNLTGGIIAWSRAGLPVVKP
jgi:rhodanese-related sulfurtransferase